MKTADLIQDIVEDLEIIMKSTVEFKNLNLVINQYFEALTNQNHIKGFDFSLDHKTDIYHCSIMKDDKIFKLKILKQKSKHLERV